MNNPSLRLLTVLTLGLALGACATRPPAPSPAAIAADSSQTPAEAPERPFSKDTLYDLLLAEFAANRSRADITLTRYAEQAKATRDPNVLERATEISQLLKAQPLTLELAQMWVQADPQSLDARTRVLLNALRNQRFDLAITALDGLLHLSPDADLEQVFLSGLPPTREARIRLLTALDAMTGPYAGSPQVAFARALVQEQNGDRDDALRNVRLAEQGRPRDIPSILLEARLLMEGGDDKAASHRLASALRDQPDSRALRLNYARILIHAGNYKDAEEQYQRLIAAHPEDADSVLTLALLALERHESELARTNLERLVDMGAHEDEAHYYLGSLARARKDDDEALTQLEEVGPGAVFLNARQDMADILLARNDVAGARQKLAAGRSIDPDMAPQLYAMEADLLTRAKQPQQAFELLDSALRTDPDNDLLLYSRAMTAEKINKLDVFEADLHKLLTRDPNNATALNALGYTLADRNDRLGEAQGYISKALALRPDDPAIIDSMGWVIYRQGDPKSALTYLQKAYKLDPDDEIAAHVGEVLWVLGRKDEARQIWKDALSRVPDSEFVLATESRLDGKH